MKEVDHLRALNFKWKRKHWYLLILFNASIPLILAINRILKAKTQNSNNLYDLLMMSVLPPVIATLLAFYCWVTYKEAQDYGEIIKPTRFKYFWRGFLSSFTSFNLLVIALVISYTVGETDAVKITIYSFFGISCFLGLFSAIFSTMYEFCACFDIFYSKNKEAIVKTYLENENKLKIIKDREG